MNYVLLYVALFFVFVAHGCSCSGLMLAVYPKHVEKYETRKCLFIVRLINCAVMAVTFTIAVALCTVAIPDKWKMGFAFICAWIAMAVMWSIVFLSSVQVSKITFLCSISIFFTNWFYKHRKWMGFKCIDVLTSISNLKIISGSKFPTFA